MAVPAIWTHEFSYLPLRNSTNKSQSHVDRTEVSVVAIWFSSSSYLICTRGDINIFRNRTQRIHEHRENGKTSERECERRGSVKCEERIFIQTKFYSYSKHCLLIGLLKIDFNVYTSRVYTMNDWLYDSKTTWKSLFFFYSFRFFVSSFFDSLRKHSTLNGSRQH